MTTQVASLTARFTADTTQFDAGARRVQDTLNETDRSMRSKIAGVGTSMTQLGMQMAIPAAAINAVMGVGIKAAMDFESAFAGVVKTVDASEAELSALRDTIRDMATDNTNPLAGLDNAHETIAKIMELGGQLGVPLEDLEGFAQTIGSLTIATDLTAESASMMLAQFAAVTGMDFDNIDELGATIVALGNNSATTESQIVEFMQRLGGIGQTIGLSETEIAALGATMASVGLNPEAGGTAMTQVFNEMINAVANGGDGLEAFADVAGVSAKEFADSWNDNPMDALTTFLGGLGDLDEAAQVKALEQLGLDGVRVADTLRRLSGDTDLLTDALDLANEAWDENTALNDEAQKRLATTEAQFNVFKNTIKDVAISIGGALLPGLNDMLKVFQPVVKMLSKIIEDNPHIVRAIARIGSILGIAAAAFIGIGSAIGFVVTVLNPFTIALAALGAAWTTNFGGIRDTLQPVIDALSTSMSALKDFGLGVLEAFSGDGITGAIDFFKENIGNLGNTIKDAWGGVDLGAIKNGLIEALKSALSLAGEGLDWVYDNIVQPIANKIIDVAGTIDLDAAGQAVLDALGTAWGAIVSGGDWITSNLIQPIANKIMGAVNGVDWSSAGAAFLTMLRNAWSTILSGGTWLKDNLFQFLFDNAKSAIESVDWYQVGFDLVSAIGTALSAGYDFIAWIKDNILTPTVDNAAAAVEQTDFAGIANSIIGAVGAVLKPAFGLGSWLNETILTPMATGMIDAASQVDWSGAAHSVVSSLQSAFSGAISGVGDLLFGGSGEQTVIQGSTMFKVDQGGALKWIQDSIIQPIIDNSKAAIESVNWENVGADIVNAIGSAIGATFDFVTWIMESILQPTADNTEGAADETDWSPVPAAIFDAIGNAISTFWDVMTWVGQTIILPMITGAVNAIYNADWSEIASSIFEMLALAITLIVKIHEWVWANIVEPIITWVATKFSDADWSAIGQSILDGLASGLGDIGQWAYDNIVKPIVDQLGSIDNAIGDAVGLGSLTGDVNVPGVGNVNPLSLFGGASGVEWTGAGAINEPAGIFHRQEAVVPHDGMRVIPSPRGLMLEGSMGGGGRNVYINSVEVHGVENIEDLLDQLQRAARARA